MQPSLGQSLHLFHRSGWLVKGVNVRPKTKALLLSLHDSLSWLAMSFCPLLPRVLTSKLMYLLTLSATFKQAQWKLTGEVTALSRVQEECLFHGTGFPLKLVSIVPHLGASSDWTRETAILLGKKNVSARSLTHSLNPFISIRPPIPHPFSHLPIHPSIHLSTLSPTH